MKGYPTYAREWGPLGVALFAACVGLLALFLAWQGPNPVEEAADHVGGPIGRAVGVLADAPKLCPSGWEDTSATVGDAISYSCSKVPAIVWLNKDGSFNSAWAGSGPILKEPPDWWPRP